MGSRQPFPARGTAPPFSRSRAARAHAGAIALLALAATLAGCKTYEPRPLVPADEWAALFERGRALLSPDAALLSPGTGGSAETELDPWFPIAGEVDARDGLDLAESNAIALAYSPDLVRARVEIAVAAGLAIDAGAFENPEFFIGPRWSTDSSDTTVPASLSWGLPLWGRREARADAASAAERRARLELERLELETLTTVRRLSIEIWRAGADVQALGLLAESMGALAAGVDALVDAGEFDPTSAWLAGWERSRIVALRDERSADRRRLVAELGERIGLLPDAGLGFIAAEGLLAIRPLEESAPDRLERHPRVRAAAEEYAESEAALRLEISEQYPEIRLGVEAEDDAGDESIGFGLGVTLPLLDRNRGGIAAAEAARDAARGGYRAALLAQAHEESRARARARAAAERLATLRSGPLRGADGALAALEARLGFGRVGWIEVVAAHRAIAEARLEEIRLVAESAEAAFAAAVAGGSALAPPARAVPEGGP